MQFEFDVSLLPIGACLRRPSLRVHYCVHSVACLDGQACYRRALRLGFEIWGVVRFSPKHSAVVCVQLRL